MVLWLGMVFTVQFILMRYFRGEKYDGYLVYLHSLIFLLVGWAIYQVIKAQKFLGGVILLALLVSGIYFSLPILDWNNDVASFEPVAQKISTPVAVYARNLSSSNCAYSLAAYLEMKNKNDDSGLPIGVCLYNLDNCQAPGAVEIANVNFQNDICVIADLSKVPRENLTKKNDWYDFSTLAVYDDVQNWWKKEN